MTPRQRAQARRDDAAHRLAEARLAEAQAPREMLAAARAEAVTAWRAWADAEYALRALDLAGDIARQDAHEGACLARMAPFSD